MSAGISEDAVEECVEAAVVEWSEDPMITKCQDKYSEEEGEIIMDVMMKIVQFKCFTKTFDQACNQFIRNAYVEPLLMSLYPEMADMA